MKQIVILLFSFYGNSSASAQSPAYSAKIYPNPTKNKVQLAVSGFEPGFVFVKFLNAHGATVRQEKRLLSSGTELITLMFFFEPGYYWLMLKQNNKLVKKGLLVK
jgi:hypothetical protein